jgi:hypothetical protein
VRCVRYWSVRETVLHRVVTSIPLPLARRADALASGAGVLVVCSEVAREYSPVVRCSTACSCDAARYPS